MIGMIVTLLVAVMLLILLFGILLSATGEEEKGSAILANCMTVLFLCVLVYILFGFGSGNSIFSSSIPLAADIDRYGSLRNLFTNDPGSFALDFVELVTLIMIINWISNILKFESLGFAGCIVTKTITVLISCLLYGLLMDVIADNIVIKWAIHCLECIITGGSILYTPAMLIAAIAGIKEGNAAVAYFLSKFPSTSLGKSITSAVVSAAVLVFLVLALELQYGSISNILKGAVNSLEGIGSAIIMLMGIYFMISSLKKKKKEKE